MSYYDTIEEDLKCAKEILAKGKLDDTEWSPDLPIDVRAALSQSASGTIYGADTYPAYKLLESFVAEIERLTKSNAGLKNEIEAMKQQVLDQQERAERAEMRSLYEDPRMYDVAKKVMHDFGWPWTDPRTGITHQPPEKTPCKHPRAVTRKWVEDNTPMIDTHCPDCGYHDHGHVHGPVEGWVDENDSI